MQNPLQILKNKTDRPDNKKYPSQTYKLRFIPIGGIVGVTKNMYVYELYENNTLKDIVIVDCGIGFPREKDLGVDFVIPDITYLLDKTDKIRAILFTHGHEDHISALKFHYEKLGKPPVYGSKLTAALLEAKFIDFGLTLKVNVISYGKEYVFGDFKAEYIHTTHSIPDTCHILLKTPVGNFYHGSDFKLDLTPVYGKHPDFYAITKAGHDGVRCLLSDCLGSETPGLTASEAIVGQTFEDHMRVTKGKFIMTTFGSNISRIRQCTEAAIKFNRKICFLGRSMKQNVQLTKGLGYLPIPHNFLIDEKDVMSLPANKVCLMMPGSQGQFNSALDKIGNQQNKNIRIEKGDKVLFSSDPIPGAENEVYDLIERLTELGAQVIYSDTHEQLHASGHGKQEDLKFLMRFTNPEYLIPIGGTIRHQRQYLELARDLGFHDSKVALLKEGETYWFEKDKAYVGESIETKNIYVDAYGVGDVGNVILRDRKTLAKEGIVILNLFVDEKDKFIMEPNFVTRGFIFEKDEKILFNKAIKEIKIILNEKEYSIESVRQNLSRRLEKLFFKETGREPLVVVEIVKV
ncbi:MAG TPA: ribonuclease J [Candidatus Nitrosocosmicus sp.]|nr:ribonuclease J [Candidatus Nitrosocosmicus sp.]